MDGPSAQALTECYLSDDSTTIAREDRQETPGHSCTLEGIRREIRVQPQRFKLTYSTMFDPPEELHQRFEAALAQVKGRLGKVHPMRIGGEARLARAEFESRSPIDRDWLLARFPRGTAQDAADAVGAARAAWRPWANTPWPERVDLLRKVAKSIEERVYELAAAMALEVGKNRMESLGEVQETADLIEWYCAEMEENGGFARFLPDDPIKGFTSHNRTVLKPHGVWAVIAPFNFPMALAGGPIGAALVAGNTVVFKVASDTAWSGALLMEAFRDAGIPDGVVNHVTGGGAEVGEALVRHPDVAGITFTGSGEVGMRIVRRFGEGRWPRPCIAEMGGKNPVVVTRHADLDRAATGIFRSAFGLQGQKCSAASRVLAERPVMDELVARLAKLAVGSGGRRSDAPRELDGSGDQRSGAGSLPQGDRGSDAWRQGLRGRTGTRRRRSRARLLRGSHRGHRALGFAAFGATSISCPS